MSEREDSPWSKSGQIEFTATAPASKTDLWPEWFHAAVGKRTSGPGSPKQQRFVARGLHPFGLALGPEGSTCGSCSHLRRPGKYLKCELVGDSASEATDLRAKWRGCSKWEQRREETEQ